MEQALNLIAITGEIVAAYVIRNHIAPADLPAVIASIHTSLAAMASRASSSEVMPTSEPTPALKPSRNQIQKSITPEALISFIDGKPYKTLKRHLTAHGFTPDSYCERFGLPGDYPMVSTAYASRRSDLAKEHQFGVVRGRGAKHRVKT
ncbi:MucR family transcriptional regulator [Methylobacterium sp. J-067]|uniref:MucR family transcriptional regulator n=1 Tax=Methylobacterium sp. J-067 TaxID=2836648 RepID=UPI001FB91A67|nr:MucR family transcriptional regulator [Methylobacterium sp. J-067]MCJ2023960.1 MucR family transcriptional regulator [Methylobacterium sp. J-067]